MYDRDKTRKDTALRASLLGSALDLQIEPIGYYLNGGTLTPRQIPVYRPGFISHPMESIRQQINTLHSPLPPLRIWNRHLHQARWKVFRQRIGWITALEFDKVVCRELLKRTTNDGELIFEELGNMVCAG